MADWLRTDPAASGVELLRRARALGYPGGKSAFYEFVRRLRADERASRAPDTAPGIYAVVQFVSGDVRLAGTHAPVIGLVGALSWSRFLHVAVTFERDAAARLHCLREVLCAFGGVPLVLLWANAHLVVTRRGGTPTWQPSLAGLALHVGCALQLLGRPNRGMVPGREARRRLTRLLFADRIYQDRADLQRSLRSWLEEQNGRHDPSDGERPVDRLAVERAKLRSLPAPDTVPEMSASEFPET